MPDLSGRSKIDKNLSHQVTFYTGVSLNKVQELLNAAQTIGDLRKMVVSPGVPTGTSSIHTYGVALHFKGDKFETKDAK